MNQPPSPTSETTILFSGMDRACTYPAALDLGLGLTLDGAATGTGTGRENYYTAQLGFEWPGHERPGYAGGMHTYELRASDFGTSSLEVSVDESDLAERDAERGR